MRDLSKPTTPSGAHRQHLLAEGHEFVASLPAAEAVAPRHPEHKKTLSDIVDALAPELISLSHALHAHPEVGFEEHYALLQVQEILHRHSLDSQAGVYDIPTALRSSIESDTAHTSLTRPEGAPAHVPTIALLCEFDALPNIGHGCGHNVMCAQSVGAYLALAAFQRENPQSIPGRIVFQTTPAEENSTCKQMLVDRGAFDDVDAAIMAHSYNVDLADQTWLGIRRFRVVYHGVPAHASSAPFMGRNALDAAVLALNGLGLLRQQLPASDRIHAVIADGGAVANIIPERTELEVRIRSKHIDTLVDLDSRVTDVFSGAALMTGTGVEIIHDKVPNEMPVRSNRYLLDSFITAMRERGRNPLPFGAVPETLAASTDFGNVSIRVPGIHPLVAIGGAHLMLHTRDMADAACMPTADQAILDGAYALAATAFDFLTDADLRERVQADFDAHGGVIDPHTLFTA
ncbi:M20 family metallopeptidase [Schaalia sp. lx-260]|uniref:M20 family metallopeptidase n=1 Tax=Schaalia sp. lx-260 TaxID=2899082 RepID=UPI001E2DBF6D|nr:M20 family metallopeptidase [Schaalia sp. lx-260]MCD4550335.1 M20 family metallopeptidase [Schaalia sp. lx-260]